MVFRRNTWKKKNIIVIIIAKCLCTENIFIQRLFFSYPQTISVFVGLWKMFCWILGISSKWASICSHLGGLFYSFIYSPVKVCCIFLVFLNVHRTASSTTLFLSFRTRLHSRSTPLHNSKDRFVPGDGRFDTSTRISYRDINIHLFFPRIRVSVFFCLIYSKRGRLNWFTYGEPNDACKYSCLISTLLRRI